MMVKRLRSFNSLNTLDTLEKIMRKYRVPQDFLSRNARFYYIEHEGKKGVFAFNRGNNEIEFLSLDDLDLLDKVIEHIKIVTKILDMIPDIAIDINRIKIKKLGDIKDRIDKVNALIEKALQIGFNTLANSNGEPSELLIYHVEQIDMIYMPQTPPFRLVERIDDGSLIDG